MAEQFPGRAVPIVRFVKEIDNIEWLIDGLLPNVGWTLLVGRKGVGKTTFAIQLCCALQDGTPFLQRSTQQCKVLYIQADSVEVEWRSILRRVAPHSHGYTMVAVPVFALDNPTYVAAILDLIGKVQPGYIVFDSLYRLSRRPLNSERVMDTLDILSMLCGAVPWLLIHHPPHEESRASGHNSIGGTCSNDWYLAKNKLVITKGRLVKAGEVLLERDESGLWIVKSDDTVSGGKDDDILGRMIL